MRRPRFSIASVLAVISILGVALAAFRDPSYLWANVTFSVAFAALVLAIINAIYGSGASRAYWLGFILCGWTYFAICSVPGLRESICPRLVTEVIFDLIYPHVSPQPPPPQPGPGIVGGPAQMTILVQGQVGGMGGIALPAPPAPESRWAAWSAPDRTNGIGYAIGTVSLVSSEAFRQIGHSLVTLLAAVLGGVYARRRYEAWAMRDMAQQSHR